MITSEYCKMMARYNRWQNTSLMNAACSLSDTDRWADRGAFFGSIAATFNHLLWDDALWLARFGGNERPEDSISVSLRDPADWSEFCAARQRRDSEIEAWAHGLAESDLTGDLAWYPAGLDKRVKKPKAVCAIHFFNHQTHHRGQIHAMLTAAGTEPEATDLPMLEP